MDILLIGNGFDLAHGLPTDYGSYLTFLELISKFNKNPDKAHYSSFCKYQPYIDYVDNLFNDENKEKRKLLVRTANENKWIKHFRSVFTEREQKDKKGWIDFESEISSGIQTLDMIKRDVADKTIFHDKDVNVGDELTDYMDSFIEGVTFKSGTRRGFLV